MEEFQWSKEQVKWERKITIYKTDIKELSNIMHKDLKCERCTKIYNVKTDPQENQTAQRKWPWTILILHVNSFSNLIMCHIVQFVFLCTVLWKSSKNDYSIQTLSYLKTASA